MVAFIAAYLAPDGMRRIKQWDAEITADILTNILQPGRFAQLDRDLTIRIRERQPGGVLGGIFVDDRRDPKERVTIIADHGTILKNENGSYLVLEDGNLERFEAGKRDPALVAFGRYAFDMSKFSNQRPRRHARDSRTLSLGIAAGPRLTIRCTSNCPDSSAPNCTTASSRRSIPSRSRC